MKVTINRTLRRLVKISMLCCCLMVAIQAGAARGAGPENRFAMYGEAKVHYLTSGRGEEALIFVHGWTCDSTFWRGQINAFPALRVIAVDLPGHGQSDKPRLDYTMDYFARSIEAVMRDAGVKRAALVGHSMGAPVIRQFYRDFPEKTLGLVIVDGELRLTIPKEKMEPFIGQLRSDYKAFAPQMVDSILTQMKDEKMKDDIRRAMLSTPDYVAVSAFVSMVDERIYGMDPIKVPVLAVLAKSPFKLADTEQFLRSLAPRLELYMWDNVSHFLMMEKPREFNETLQGFLSKNGLLKK